MRKINLKKRFNMRGSRENRQEEKGRKRKGEREGKEGKGSIPDLGLINRLLQW